MEIRSVTSTNPIEPNPLASLMERARRDAFFLGHALAGFALRKGFDDKSLAEHLRCPLDRLSQLFLCRCPDGEDPKFAQEVRIIAEYAPCDEMRLLLALRESVAFAKLSKPAPGKGSQTLLAARDRHEEENLSEENAPPEGETESS